MVDYIYGHSKRFEIGDDLATKAWLSFKEAHNTLSKLVAESRPTIGTAKFKIFLEKDPTEDRDTISIPENIMSEILELSDRYTGNISLFRGGYATIRNVIKIDENKEETDERYSIVNIDIGMGYPIISTKPSLPNREEHPIIKAFLKMIEKGELAGKKLVGFNILTVNDMDNEVLIASYNPDDNPMILNSYMNATLDDVYLKVSVPVFSLQHDIFSYIDDKALDMDLEIGELCPFHLEFFLNADNCTEIETRKVLEPLSKELETVLIDKLHEELGMPKDTPGYNILVTVLKDVSYIFNKK